MQCNNIALQHKQPDFLLTRNNHYAKEVLTMKDAVQKRFDKIVDKTREGTVDLADNIKKTKKPVHKVADKGLMINDIAHRYIERMVRQQVKFVDASVDEGSKRLRLASKADGVKDLFEGQWDLMPKTRDRIKDGVKDTVDIFADTGEELRDVFRKAPKAKKVVRKAPARKAAAKKKPVRKTTVRKATPIAPAPKKAA